MSSRKGKGKSSQISIQPTGKGPEAYKDVDWKTMNDDEAKAAEKESSLAWKVLSNTQVQQLLGLAVEDMEKALSEMLELGSYARDLKEATLLDYYTSAVWWAKEEGFNAQQVSGFFTVVHTLMANVKAKMSAAENVIELRKMLVGIGTDSVETNGGLDFLSVKQAKLISDYLEMALFQTYSLYYFLHHEEREEQIICTDLAVAVLPPAAMPFPAPLDEGLEEAVYLKHVAPPPPTPPPEEEQEVAQTAENDGKAEDVTGETKTEDQGVGVGDGETGEESSVDRDVLAGVSMEEIKSVFDKVAKEMFDGLQSDIALQLKEREADIITRINRIHRIAEV